MTEEIFERHRTPSQCEDADRCWRRWAWRYVDGVEPEQKGAASKGDAVHKVLEDWLEGRPVDWTTDAAKIAMTGLHLIPRPQTNGVEVERRFSIRLGGHWIRGRSDWRKLGEIPEVGDHKTSGDIEKHAKTEEELATNIQAAIYAADVMGRSGTNAADLVWVYYPTKKGAKKAKRVHLRVTRDDITPTLQRVIAIADAMREIDRRGLRALDLPPNKLACDDYGGCHFISHCGLTTAERFDAIMTQPGEQTPQMMGFVARMDQARGAGQAINPPPPQQLPVGTPMGPGWAMGPAGIPVQVPIGGTVTTIQPQQFQQAAQPSPYSEPATQLGTIMPFSGAGAAFVPPAAPATIPSPAPEPVAAADEKPKRTRKASPLAQLGETRKGSGIAAAAALQRQAAGLMMQAAGLLQQAADHLESEQ